VPCPPDGPVLGRTYRAYLFDLDGTLVDSAPDINRALNAALTGEGYPAVDGALSRDWVGFGSTVLLERALRHHDAAHRIADGVHMQHLMERFITYYSAHIADFSQVYPGVVPALQALQARGAGLAVVTNKFAALSLQLLDALGLAPFFTSVVGGDTLTVRKPDAAPALHACRALGCNPVDALFVGDSPTDVATARAAGCAVVCLRDGYRHGIAVEALGADAIIDSLTELL
jgi:phosphoglycolate phosphatase